MDGSKINFWKPHRTVQMKLIKCHDFVNILNVSMTIGGLS